MGVGQEYIPDFYVVCSSWEAIPTVSPGGIGCVSPNDQGTRARKGRDAGVKAFVLFPSFSISLSSLTVTGPCYPDRSRAVFVNSN